MSDRDPYCRSCKRRHRKIEAHEIAFTWFCFIVLGVLGFAIVREVVMLLGGAS